MEKAMPCTFQANYHPYLATKYRRKVLVGPVEVRLLEVLKMIAENHGYQLLAVRVHHGDHVHVFVSAKPMVHIPDIVAVLKSNSARLLFDEFSEIKLRLWSGYLSGGYAVRTAGVVTIAKSKNTSTVFNFGCSPQKGQVVHLLKG